MKAQWRTFRNGVLALIVPFALSLLGCATGPNLRALNPREAKIDVYPTGEIRVLGEKIVPGDLCRIVATSATESGDSVLIRLHDDPDTPAMTELRKIVTDQMLRAGHTRFSFFSVPQASVTTIDPRTGRVETYVSDQPVKILSGNDMAVEVDRMAAEQKAYADGSYVSEAIGQKAVIVDTPPEELGVKPNVVGGTPVPANGSKPLGATTARSPSKVQPATPRKPAGQQESLREAWLRQQRQRGK